MKASPKIFRALADIVEKGVSPSRAGKVLKISPDTVSRWRADYPEFAEMLDQAESRFIQRMISAIADAAPKDWRAAVELLARRFPAEFGRDSGGATRELAKPFVDRDEELRELAATPAGRSLLIAANIIDQSWLATHFPAEKVQLLPCRSGEGQ
jgi:hypothetical protein